MSRLQTLRNKGSPSQKSKFKNWGIEWRIYNALIAFNDRSVPMSSRLLTLPKREDYLVWGEGKDDKEGGDQIWDGTWLGVHDFKELAYGLSLFKKIAGICIELEYEGDDELLYDLVCAKHLVRGLSKSDASILRLQCGVFTDEAISFLSRQRKALKGISRLELTGVPRLYSSDEDQSLENHLGLLALASDVALSDIYWKTEKEVDLLLAALANSNVTNLSLTSVHLDNGFKGLFGGLRGLTALALKQCNVAPQDIGLLGGLRGLTALALDHCSVAPQDMQPLYESDVWSSLESLSLVETFATEESSSIVYPFEDEESTEKPGALDAVIVSLAAALKKASKLKKFAFAPDGSNMGPLFASLRACEALTSLDLSTNRKFVIICGEGSEALLALAALLDSSPVTELNLRKTGLGDGHLRALLPSFRRLQKLDLSDNELTKVGVRDLMFSLPETSIVDIGLARCVEVDVFLETVLSLKGSALKRVDLSHPIWGGQPRRGTAAAIASLAGSQLEFLSLASRKVGHAAMCALLDVLPQMPQLREIALPSDKLSTRRKRQLAEVIGRCSSLEFISKPRGREVKDALLTKLFPSARRSSPPDFSDESSNHGGYADECSDDDPDSDFVWAPTAPSDSGSGADSGAASPSSAASTSGSTSTSGATSTSDATSTSGATSASSDTSTSDS